MLTRRLGKTFLRRWDSVDYEPFVESRIPALLRVATAMTGDYALAEDLVQEVALKAQLQWSRVSTADNPDAYVQRMLVNEFVSFRRKWSRITPTADVEVTTSAPDLAVGVTERQAMQTRLQRLPRQQQVVLAMRYYAGMTDIEIARYLGCAPGTVRGYASRALAALRASFPSDSTEIEVRTR